jgi:hypothetical protein
MSKRDGNQKGAQNHPEGGHGDRTHKKIVEQLKSNKHGTDKNDNPLEDAQGKHHIYEDRQQHDEADKNSEKDRLRHDRSKGRA